MISGYKLLIFYLLGFVFGSNYSSCMEENRAIELMTTLEDKKNEDCAKLAKLLIKLYDRDSSEFFNEILSDFKLISFQKTMDLLVQKFGRQDIIVDLVLYFFNQQKEVLYCYFEYVIYLLNLFLREDLTDFHEIDDIYKTLSQRLMDIFSQEQHEIKFAPSFERSAQKIVQNFRNNYSARMGRLYASLYKDQLDKIINYSGVSAEELAAYIFEHYDNYFHTIEEGMAFLDFLFPDISDSNDNVTLNKILDILESNHKKFNTILNTYTDFVEYCPRAILFIAELKKLIKL